METLETLFVIDNTKCPHCKGTGGKWDVFYTMCRNCLGLGKILKWKL